MLTVLVGSDKIARARRLEALIAPLQKKGADVRMYTDVNFDTESVRALAGGTSLFGGVMVGVLTGVCDTAEMRDTLERLIPELSESQHQFIVSENALLAPFLKKVESKKGTVEKFELKDKPKKEEVFNAFALTDAFADRKRALAWPLYRKAIDLGVEPRELHGKIFWVVKSMLIADGAKSAGESGLNPFVYQKSKRAAANFAPGHLGLMARELTVMFHESLVSGLDIETALESFILRSLAK
jgi:DNA polymerase III delta subunit